jgi:hypothetical protein
MMEPINSDRTQLLGLLEGHLIIEIDINGKV